MYLFLFCFSIPWVPQFQATDAAGKNDHGDDGLEGVGEVGDTTLEQENTGDFGWERQRFTLQPPNIYIYIGGGFKYFLFSSLLGEDFQFD